MTPKSLHLFAAVTAAVLMFPALAPAQTAPPITVNVPQLNEQDFHRWAGKSNAYVELLNGSMRAIDSLQRYADGIDMKVGPTGKERFISGPDSVEAPLAAQAIAKARAAAAAPPPIPPLDDAALAFAASFETLVPIINDAAAYYARKDYADDHWAGAKALHAKIIPAMNAFFVARERLQDGQDQLSAGLARRELALIEAHEGKSRRWHLRNLAITAKAAFDVMPQDPNATDMTAFSSAITALADALSGYEGLGTPDATSARNLVARFRTLREKIEKKDADDSDFRDALNAYNGTVLWLNSPVNN
jgi:hypothetical protein